MNHYQGKILRSTSTMDDPHFNSSLVFIAEHNENGALGFIINQVFDRPLNHLVEFADSPAFPLFKGGPVDQDHLYFIHRRNDLIPGGTLIIEPVYWGGDFQKAISHINQHQLTSKDIKIFIGYCGWDTNDLETEIAEKSWNVEELKSTRLFD